MSNMHHAIESWAKQPGERVARSLTERDALAKARVGIARGRRRRTLGASASAFAVVGVLVLAVGVVPGWFATDGRADPARSDRWLAEEGAIAWRDGGAVVGAPFVLGPRMTLGEALGDPLSCGATWDFEPGAYAHDAEATQEVERFVASAVFREDGKVLDGPAAVMTPERSELVWQFAYRQGVGGPGVEFHVAAVVVADGIVVGRGAIGGGAGGGTVTSGDVAPFPGECHELAQTEFFAPYVPTDDGTYEQHLVIQFVDAITFQPVATFVDPAGSFSIEYVDLMVLAQLDRGRAVDNEDAQLWRREEDEPSPGRFDYPASGIFSGRVVPATAGGNCMPQRQHLVSVIADRAAPQIPMALDNVNSHESAFADVIASVHVPAGEEPPWFAGEDAWLVVERGDLARLPRYLEWRVSTTSDGAATWALTRGNPRRDPTVTGPDCYMTLDLVPSVGQVWLVFAGRGELIRTDDQAWETWVYLGEMARFPDL